VAKQSETSARSVLFQAVSMRLESETGEVRYHGKTGGSTKKRPLRPSIPCVQLAPYLRGALEATDGVRSGKLLSGERGVGLKLAGDQETATYTGRPSRDPRESHGPGVRQNGHHRTYQTPVRRKRERKNGLTLPSALLERERGFGIRDPIPSTRVAVRGGPKVPVGHQITQTT